MQIAILSALASFPALPQSEQSVRWYDLRGLSAYGLIQDSGVVLRPHAVGLQLSMLEPDAYDVPLEESYADAFDELEDLLELLLSERFDLGEYSLDQRGGLLRVEGTKEVHGDIVARLAELEALAADRVAVEVWRVPAAALPSELRATLPAFTVEALLATPGLQLVAQRQVALGRRATLAQAALASAHYDYDVEVAQGAVVADPLVTVVPTGTDFAVQVRLMTDGGLHLRAWGRHGVALRPFPVHAIPSLAGATLELPKIASEVVYGSAQLASGEAIVLGSGDMVFLVRVERAATATMHVGPLAPLQPMGALTMRSVRALPVDLAHAAPSGGTLPEERDLSNWVDNGDPILDPDEVLQALTALRDSRGLTGRIARFGDLVYAPDSEPLRAALRTELDALTAALVPETAGIEFRFGALESADIRERTLTELADALPGRARGSVRMGESLTLVDTVDSLYIMDFDVELAQAAAIADPVIGRVSLGTTLWCVPQRTPSGAWSVTYEIAHHASDLENDQSYRTQRVAHWDPKPAVEVERIPLPIGAFRLADTIQLPATRRTTVRGTIVGEEGAWQLVHAGPEGGDSPRLFVVTARFIGQR